MPRPDSATMACARKWEAGSQMPAFVAVSLHLSRWGWMRMPLVLLLLLGVGHPTTVHAAEPDVVSLEREVIALKAAVQQLQARLDRLERQPALAEQPAPGVPRVALSTASQAAVQDDSRATPKAALLAAPLAARQPGEDPVAQSPQAQLRINWSKVDSGMTTDEVSRLLGEPTRRLQLDGRDVWYYSYPALGNGSVFFTHAGHVSSHQSPFAWGG